MLTTDTWNIRMVIGFLGAIVVLVVLKINDVDKLVVIGTTALGALAGILATTRSSKAPDVPAVEQEGE